MNDNMNNKDIEKLLLLRDSGELSHQDRRLLEDAISNEPERVARIDNELRSISALAASEEVETAMDRSVADAILEVARAKTKQRKSARNLTFKQPFLNVWRPAITYAAAALFLLLASIPLWNHFSDTVSKRQAVAVKITWGKELEQNLSELDQEISLALMEYSELADSDRNIDELANELIKMKETEI